jgi:Ca-activated chloride channel family protein
MIQKRAFTVLFVFLLALLTIGIPLAAQAPARDPNMVYMPVAVTGAKNAYISGLKKENFRLLENGIEQTIGFFSEDNQPFEMHIILAMASLQRGRSDLNSSKIREAVETFRQSNNANTRFKIEEMPFGSNGVFDAMSRHVAELAAVSNPRKALVVMTDGFDSAGGDPGRALQEYAKKQDVPIHLIFTALNGETQTEDLATVARGGAIHLEGGTIYEDLTKFTGGRLYQAEADTQLKSALQTLAQEFKGQYILGFKSTNDARDDKWRKIEVKIVKPPEGMKDLKTKVRDRYFVAKVKK